MSNKKDQVLSVEVAARLLRAFASAPGAMMLKDIAAAASVPAAKAHRYLVSLCRVGLVEQAEPSGPYDLGPFALSLGLTALGRIAPLKSAEPLLEPLRASIGQTIAVADWGEQGPVIVRWIGVDSPVAATLRVGASMPWTRSATGQAFLAFAPERVSSNRVDWELADNRRHGLAPSTSAELADHVAKARRIGFASTSDFIPGISGLAAPVYDHSRGMVLALIALGYSKPFSEDGDRIAAAIVKAAQQISVRLGWKPTG